ncbi:MAG: D-glycero-beta-D-manno-heptose-7-phosphate kinase [Deltaproteobacteria bacterium]|nr:D-glycero-beta-D-manno-heptose-7-phosphate kinase [Deltaproteobacteria bacterium]
MTGLLSDKKARSIIRGFKKARVLVIGDIIMDHFIWGGVTRISPEAPVPVVDVTGETILLGGAANVVNNIMRLGGRSFVAGVVGADSDGRRLREMLKSGGVSTEGVVVDRLRPTTIKTRVIAHHQQVVRFDRERKDRVAKKVCGRVLDYIEKAWPDADAVVVSDYAKGIVTPELMDAVRELVALDCKPVVVDPKVEHFDYYRGMTVATPNNHEAGLASGIEIKDASSLNRAGRALMKRIGSRALLITRGESGMSLFEEGGQTHIPTVAREVYDVSGAGDTVVAVMALSLAAGAALKEASVLANLAAGRVVEKLGTATVSPLELKEAVSAWLEAVEGSR